MFIVCTIVSAARNQKQSANIFVIARKFSCRIAKQYTAERRGNLCRRYVTKVAKRGLPLLKGSCFSRNPTGSCFSKNPTGSCFSKNPTGSCFSKNPTGSCFSKNPVRLPRCQAGPCAASPQLACLTMTKSLLTARNQKQRPKVKVLWVPFFQERDGLPGFQEIDAPSGQMDAKKQQRILPLLLFICRIAFPYSLLSTFSPR